jgi:hypothetical protein
LDIVGNVKNFLQPGCSASTVLAENTNAHINFSPATLVRYAASCALTTLYP